MFVKRVEQFSGYEADLVVSDGQYNIKCHFSCFPPLIKIKEEQPVREILTFLSENIVSVEQNKYLIKKKENYYAYYLQGKVIALDKPMISIGDLIIMLDSVFPKDISIGDYVGLNVKRLDCIL